MLEMRKSMGKVRKMSEKVIFWDNVALPDRRHKEGYEIIAYLGADSNLVALEIVILRPPHFTCP